MNNSHKFKHTICMKKLKVILLTAALAAAACCSAACSKGQTGGGNNAMQGYVREPQSVTEECPDGDCNENDCGDCKDNRRDNCKNNDCRNGERHRGGRHNMRRGKKHGKPTDKNESAERRNNFEFDSDRGMPHRRKGFELIVQDGRFTNGKQLPPPEKKHSEGDGITQNEDKQSETGKARQGENKNCGDKGGCKNGDCDDCKDEGTEGEARRPKKPRFGARPQYRKTDNAM